MAWLILVVAGLLEIVWATALKQSDGLSRLWPSVIGIGGAVLSFTMLAVALRQLPAGTVARVLFLSVIVVGIVGLRLAET